jgi:carboxymethylenebutenolidase
MTQHPDLSRRAVLATLAGLPLAAILADPALAQKAAQATSALTITTAGGQQAAAALAKPDTVPAPAVMLVHEWWGLNDQIKAVTMDLARQGYLALAIDLFKGQVATQAGEAKSLTEKLDADEAADTMTSWAQWLSNHQDSNRRMAAMGWCFGGGQALLAGTLSPFAATVVYYGKVNLPAERLRGLQGPVLGHFGKRDQFITAQLVGEFEKTMKAVGKPYTVFWYDAGHAFANPTGNNFSKPDAQLAWQRTLEFLGKTLRG